MKLYVEVVLALPIDRSFIYIVPPALSDKISIGQRVLVPFGVRILTGYVIKIRHKSPSKQLQFKEIKEVMDDHPVFSLTHLDFIRKLSQYYFSSWGELLQASLPPSLAVKSRMRFVVTEKGKAFSDKAKLSDEEKQLLELIKDGPLTELNLRRKLKSEDISSVVSSLVRKELIEKVYEIHREKRRQESIVVTGPAQLEMDFSLDSESSYLAINIGQALKMQKFSQYLLYSPSKKRRAIYIDLIRQCLGMGRRILVLVPEIGQTQDFIRDIETRLGEKAALLHSRLTRKQRELVWQRIQNGEVDVVVGPRSALLTQIPDLGLLIVDEEQDDSYYQQESPAYDARQGAWLRAKHEGLVLVYGSSCPSIRARFRAKKGGYLLRLKEKPPKRQISILDDRYIRAIISPKIVDRIKARLDYGEPVLVFCNRRGYAAFIFCSRCHYVPRCQNCSITLSYHKRDEALVCHYCNYRVYYQGECPQCGRKMILWKGPGIEVIAEELRRKFPQQHVVSFYKDEAAQKTIQKKILHDFVNGKIDILLGTSLLAHQFELPPISMIVIFCPEITLSVADFQASFRTFHNLRQMMRFLRDDKTSELLLQTAMPEHYSIRYAAFGDCDSFYHREIQFRRLMKYPPLNHMAEIVIQGEKLRTIAKEMREFTDLIKQADMQAEILGPAIAPLSKIRGKNRIQLILKAKNKKTLDVLIREPLKVIKAKKSVFLYE